MPANLVRVYIKLEVPEQSESVFSSIAQRAADAGEEAVRALLREGGFDVKVRVEEGSAKTRIVVVASIAWIIQSLANYDGAFGGLERLSAHSRMVGEAVRVHFRGTIAPDERVARSSIDTADVRRLRYVLELVADGVLTVDAGVDGILRVIERDNEIASPEAIDRIKATLERVPRELPRDVTDIRPPANRISELPSSTRSRISAGGSKRATPAPQKMPTKPKLVIEVSRKVNVGR